MAKRTSTRVFVSHSSSDKSFAALVVKALRGTGITPWIDKEQIQAGDDVLAGIGDGLRTMDALIFIVSRRALESPWVERELKFATRKEIEDKQIIIVPFIIDETSSAELPWFLQHLRAVKVSPDEAGAASVAVAISARFSRRLPNKRRAALLPPKVKRDPAVDRIIGKVGLGQWKTATAAALEIIDQTDENGRNELFEVLLGYQNVEDESLWPALHVIEMCADLAPSLMNRTKLTRMARHTNYTVRSSAASICMNWANFAPSLVPIDLLLKLSVYDEDWYVQAPANAALKTLVRSIPGVLQIFYSRLQGADEEARAHSAACLLDIAGTEPDLLDRDDLVSARSELARIGDRDALEYIVSSLAMAKPRPDTTRYKYGL